MASTKLTAAEKQKNEPDSILKWIDGLAKIVVVITALLYIVGRSYVESYYAHMGVPTSNLPLNFQEYLFMSTKSLSFLQSAASASFISIITGLFFNFAVNGAKTLFETLVGRFTKNEKEKKQSKSNSHKSDEGNQKAEAENKDDELKTIEKSPKKSSKDTDEMIYEVQSKVKNWLQGKLIYIIPTFIVLVFFMLIPSARASGSVASESAIQNAPLGRVLLNQPSIPELTPQIYTAQKDVFLYDYGKLPVVGLLGENYLIVLENQDGTKNILAIPTSEVVSINYVNFISLTPTLTITETPTLTPMPSETVTPTPSKP
jgi:hypothetical protein